MIEWRVVGWMDGDKLIPLILLIFRNKHYPYILKVNTYEKFSANCANSVPKTSESQNYVYPYYT